MYRADRVADLLFAEQDRLVAALEERDTQGRFRPSDWTRAEVGHGRVRVLEQGLVFERAGVNVSVLHGDRLPPSAVDPSAVLPDGPYLASGISLVAHPVNPYAPTLHANFRFFEVTGGPWWFGAVVDLTPAYGFDEDAVHFHRTLRDWCDRHDPEFYATGKANCDEYFWLPHRNEMRGIGGVFLERLRGDGPTGFDRLLAFVADGLDTLFPAYLPILDRRCWQPYQERQRSWQLLRRGRYVEFNLGHDGGTCFGLYATGNIEPMLMSLPPMAGWGFQVNPEPGSPEADTARFLRPTDWAGDITRREIIGIGPTSDR